MASLEIKRNERDWTGQLISWIKSAIEKKETIFQDATNDTSVKMSSGRTKYPDVLLYIDKLSGIVFNGWELKFPDTDVDDREMLLNALEKAKRITSDSFVTWNGSEAVIWKIDTSKYSVESLTRLKEYPKVETINSREDLSIPSNFTKHEPILRQRALDILHDLEQLLRDGEIKPAISISASVITAIEDAAKIIVPQFSEAIEERIGSDAKFRKEFNKWKIYENATLAILSSSSRKVENVDAKDVLAKFTFYNLIGKILFYLTLSENLSGKLRPLSLTKGKVKENLTSFFEDVKAIDYQAVFQPYFTDDLEFSELTDHTLCQLAQRLAAFDFKLLPTEVIGTILENIVPEAEQQKFGQYFTSPLLAHLAAFPAVASKNSILFDPTSGTGTFLTAFYDILSYFGNKSHRDKLSQIWGNDISHFPAILSVINLYKQNLSETNNFPRVVRDDFFNLNVGQQKSFPDPYENLSHLDVEIPVFDGIASNFPFIQQEDIPGKGLTEFFKSCFGKEQKAFVEGKKFKINRRSDYFAYCIYNAYRFLKIGGVLSAITSNAWLGKEYGLQLKSFLLDNFHIKYIVRSKAEHWFSASKVSTIFIVLEKCSDSTKPTRFVTLNFKLEDYFNDFTQSAKIAKIEELYSRIDNCAEGFDTIWKASPNDANKFITPDNSVEVTLIPKQTLSDSISDGTNWAQYFVAENPLAVFDDKLIKYDGNICKIRRGLRTGWNMMFVISDRQIKSSGINPAYLAPYLKSSGELSSIRIGNNFKYRLFVCDKDEPFLDSPTQAWINRFKNQKNKNGKATIPQICKDNSPHWYSLSPNKTQIVTTINPNERLFFAYSDIPFIIDQRLISLEIYKEEDAELVAALLNSVFTLLTIELKGTSRHLGVLDLNANFLKEMRLLNPALIDNQSRKKILAAFDKINNRQVLPIKDEILQKDRKKFDETVLKAYGIDAKILPELYKLLRELVSERINMKNK